MPERWHRRSLPLLFFVGFTGALSVIGNSEGFEYYDYTAFIFVFVVYMAAMVVGMFTAFDITFDYQSGTGAPTQCRPRSDGSQSSWAT